MSSKNEIFSIKPEVEDEYLYDNLDSYTDDYDVIDEGSKADIQLQQYESRQNARIRKMQKNDRIVSVIIFSCLILFIAFIIWCNL